jgi:hypothetical protein
MLPVSKHPLEVFCLDEENITLGEKFVGRIFQGVVGLGVLNVATRTRTSQPALGSSPASVIVATTRIGLRGVLWLRWRGAWERV